MPGQGLKYNVDIVMCIDCTGSMGHLLDMVKAQALKFHSELHKRCEENGKEISNLRIRTISFRDFLADGNRAIADTGFLDIPSQESEFNSFINSLTPNGGGDEPENGLEAVAMAINSDWTTGGDKKRHVIVVWSDASTHPLGVGKENPTYPQNMPASFDELTDWWDDEQCGKMDPSAKRIIIFAPDASEWNSIGTQWNNAIHHPAKAGEGLSDIDYKTILEAIANSI